MLQKLKNSYHFFLALLATIFYGFPSRQLTVVGVTGTDGKTTTTSLIYHLLFEAGYPIAMITSVEARFGQECLTTGLHVTTPNSWWLQRTLRQMVNQGIKYLALEVTSHGLDQYRVLGVNFKLAVFTNVTHEHLDYHRTWENYLAAKARLMNRAKLVILNQDDQSFKSLKQRAEQLGLSSISYSLKSSQADLTPKKLKFKTNLAGDYNCSNCLAAIGAANALGVSLDQIRVSLPKFKGVKGRMEVIKTQFGFQAVIDFAHTPNALEKVLQTLKTQTKGKLIAVFGAAGERDQSKRPLMGQVAGQLADIVILTAEDPRTESVEKIMAQILSGNTNSQAKFILQPDRQQAINLAIKLAKSGDLVGIFGKGHEESMCFGKQETTWSDQVAVKRALTKRKRGQR